MTQEELQATISATLKKGERIIIPGLGYLELQELAGRRSAAFKAATPDNAVMQSLSGTPANSLAFIAAAQEIISDPLSANQPVNLPEIGTFKPIVSDRGVRVLYTVATPLRKVLNEGLPPVTTTTTTTTKPVITAKPVITTTTTTTTTTRDVRGVQGGVKKVDPEPEKGGDEPRVPKKFAFHADAREALIALCAVLLLAIVVAFFSLEREAAEAKLPEVTNLMDEAERHYGNTAYWSYIYEANRSIINSPLNVPKTLKLTYPDLSEQGIDVKNPAEIKKAELKGSIILKQINK
ncbi:hypothetical protein AGMMS49965_03840 [Bacteroidia bacterium]|nr:hypothetical protein AGMMS49965_03840 [Bacteroidia bacterium]